MMSQKSKFFGAIAAVSTFLFLAVHRDVRADCYLELDQGQCCIPNATPPVLCNDPIGPPCVISERTCGHKYALAVVPFNGSTNYDADICATHFVSRECQQIAPDVPLNDYVTVTTIAIYEGSLRESGISCPGGAE